MITVKIYEDEPYFESTKDIKLGKDEEFVEDINKEMGSTLSIIEEFMYDMLDENYKPKSPNYDLDLYSYEIIQCVVRD